MKYRNLGKHGLKVSELSIGTTYHGSYISKKDSHKVLATALEEGINYIDCANRYGIFDSDLPMEERTRSEKILGEFIQDYNREDLVLSTKVFYKMRDTPNSGGLSKKHIREEIKDSLNYLNTDYIDIYYCHRSVPDTPLEETIRTMTNLIDDGLVNYWGTSWFPPVKVERMIHLAKEIGCIPPSVEQPPYAFDARFIENDLFDVVNYHGLGLVTFEALAGGFYTGKYLDGIPEGSRGDKTKFVSEEVKERDLLTKLNEIAKELDISLAQLALAWTLRNKEISSSLMGASKPNQVIHNVKASDVELDNEILERIEKILDNKPVSEYR
jgi:aryl-alcohol dehydrogenase-like predicted oxidoreductase